MKIRSDFVTNSSSSSFVVTLCMKLRDGRQISLNSEKTSGDVNEASNTLEAYDENRNRIKHITNDPMSVMEYIAEYDEEGSFYEEHDPDELAGVFGNKIEIGRSTDIKGVKAMADDHFAGHLADAFSFYDESVTGLDGEGDEDDGYEDDEYEDDEYGDEGGILNILVEKAIEQYRESSKEAREYLAENIKSREDIAEMSLSMNFAGRGEMLAGPEEILHSVFGYEDGEAIYSAARADVEKDPKDIADELFAKGIATDYSLQALVNAIVFARELDYSPDEANVSETITEDGKINLEFQFN